MLWLLAALAMQTASAATAEVRSDGAGARTLTIYRDDLAFVTETHVVDLPEGRSRVVFAGVNDRMVPQTAVLTAFEGVTLERNFDQGLLTKASLFEALVGERAVLTRTNPGSGRREDVPAEVLSAARGVVVRTPEGVETLDCAGLPQTLAAPERPDGLLSVPELSVVVSADEAGPREMRLAYLAEGLGWSADYVLTVGAGAGEEGGGAPAALRGWLTFTNETKDRFDAVPTAIIAGTLRTTGDTRAPEPDAPTYHAACWPRGTTTDIPLRRARNPYLLGLIPPPPAIPRANFEPEFAMARAAPMAESDPLDEIVLTGARTASEERFGDYRLYRPPGPVTLTPYRTKQVAFLDEAEVGVQRRYDFDLYPYMADVDGPLTPDALYLIDNEAGGALARALPAGTVRVMTVADGEVFYLGQDEIRDLAVGLPVEIAVGGATDVMARLTMTDGRRQRSALRVTIGNAMTRPAPVRIALPGWRREERGHASFTGEDNARVKGEPSPTWDVTVPANGTRTLRLTIAYE